MHLFWVLCFPLADVKVVESLMQAVHPWSLKTIQNIKKFKHMSRSIWFMYLNPLSTEYSECTFWWVKISTYPHCCSGFCAGTVNIHVLTRTISLMGRNKTYKKLCLFIYIHRFAAAAYTCTELQDVLSKGLSVSLSKWEEQQLKIKTKPNSLSFLTSAAVICIKSSSKIQQWWI